MINTGKDYKINKMHGMLIYIDNSHVEYKQFILIVAKYCVDNNNKFWELNIKIVDINVNNIFWTMKYTNFVFEKYKITQKKNNYKFYLFLYV